MTFEKQDITEDFYAGNYKEIIITIYEDELKTTPKDVTNAEITYVIFTEAEIPQIVVVKSSLRGSQEIELLVPASDGKCKVKLLPEDTLHLNGQYRHQTNMKDSNGYEETVMTGRIRIFKSFARMPGEDSLKAYLEGG